MKKSKHELIVKGKGIWFFCLFIGLVYSGGLTNAGQAQTYSLASQPGQKYFYSVQRYAKIVPKLQRIISVNVRKQPIKKVLQNITQKAGLGIAYNSNLPVLKKQISVELHDVTVAQALQKVLSTTDYKPMLSKMKELVLEKRVKDSSSLSLVKVTLQQTISGTVTDAETGVPLIGANILVIGTNGGTATDANGDYSLTVPDGADSLRFSYIGYKTVTVAINGRSVINVAMKLQVHVGEQLVVTALGITREKRAIGYATQEVSGANLSYAQNQNFVSSLSGKIAGVQITNSSGASMGGSSSIKIRGVNSMSGEDQPLIVVDGTPISNANFAGTGGADFGNLAQDINPNNIKSINVLKGPAASALYGIRGQFGVVMITTKDGNRDEAMTVSVSSNFEMQNATNFMNYQNKYGGGYSQTFSKLANGDPYVNMTADESWGPKTDGTPVRQFYSFYPEDPRYGELTPFLPHPDNVKNFFETGFKSNQGIAVAGGSDNSNYRVSFNDSRTDGVYPNTRHQRDNLGVRLDVDAGKDWTFSTNLNFARNVGRRPHQGYGGGAEYFRQWFQRSVSMKELKNYKYPDGTIKQWNIYIPDPGEMPNGAYWDNPYFLAYEAATNDKRNRIYGNFGVQYNVLPELTIKAAVRGDIYAQNIEWKTPVGVGGIVGPSGYSVGKYENREMNYGLSAQYAKNWGDFSLHATVGTNAFSRNYSYLYQSTVGGLSTPGYYNIAASVDRPDVTSYKLEKKIYSAYGMLSLGYDDTYFLDASIRNDKSSTLPVNNNSYWYPSISGSFVFSELLNWDALSFGKLRLSYAQAGSDLGPYRTTPVYGIGTVYDGINTLSVPNNLNNPNIKPSFTTSYEGGIDLNFFGRLQLSFTYYEQKSKNQVIPLAISGTSGYGSATINAGLIENKGIEIALSGTPIQTNNFTWNSHFNLGRNVNEVVKLYPGIDVYTHHSHSYSSVSSYMNSYVGAEYGILVGEAYKRDPDTGLILLDDNNMPMWTDATHKFGSVLPNFTGGFQNVFRYKNFSLAAMITFQSGGEFFSWSRMLAHKTGLAAATAAINDKGHNVRDPLSDGGGVKVVGISASTGKKVTAYVDAHDYYKNVLGTHIYEKWVTSKSYIKLSEVKLGYTFSSKILGSTPFQSIRVSLYARDPLMIWQAAPSGINPSELSSGSQDITWTETGQLVTVRTFGLNINLTF